MKQKILVGMLTSLLFIAPAFAGDNSAPAATTSAPVDLSTDTAKLSYVFGFNMGANLQKHQINIDQNVFVQGLTAGLSGAPAAMTPGQMQDAMKNFQKKMMEKQAADLKAASAKNLAEGAAFMKNFVAQKDVVKVNDDLAYKIITTGNGSKATTADTVTMTYEGKLVNGAVFDSTKRNGDKPINLPLAQVIPGMQKILTMMPVGSTWEVVMGPKVAYGERGAPMSPIGPNETLVFTLTVKSVAPTPAAPAPKAKA